MLPTPWYFNHKMALDMLGIEAVPLPCRAENGLVPDVEDARRPLTAHIPRPVLVTPEQPDRRRLPARDDSIAFRELCAEQGISARAR